MSIENNGRTRTRRRRSRGGDAASATPLRKVDYHNLKNPFPTMNVFPDHQIADMHNTALRLLEEMGMKVLLPEARKIYAAAGARIDEDNEMVFIGRDIVEAALETAPKSILLKAGNSARDIIYELGRLNFQAGAGAPNATDLERGRRPGSARDYNEYLKLTQHYDVFQMISPQVEPQDVPTNLRHYFTTKAQLELSDKFPFTFARGKPQVMDNFEMIRDFRGVSDEEFKANAHTYTIINTNSPRMLDIPMAQGLIDYAKFGQMSIVTPFCLMGAMAPITVAGAITLSHAEVLASLTLAQLVNPGAPVSYGTFTSNVDMKSGAPAFGTSAHFQASLAAGQMARLLGLPWRCAAGSASNINDVQAANENQTGLWGCLMAGATVIIHSAGWLEGGLSVSYEKLITDVEVLNMIAEMCAGAQAGANEIGFDNALRHVDPGGHFFSTPQTMERYNTEFYSPIVHDYANFGTWTERGAQNASVRATSVWKKILAEFTPPETDSSKSEALEAFISKRTAEGGAPPES
ncbi:trimethylamine methyltransferase family protein [Amylibacter sp. SFDW26]|uniref:trimethylamine methyltransferase family protein n=1 Tax=Amylibacter sp. SFDW26 TaxID=2652722 RepID=UPI00126297A4|nr:trimethylamine methyltransferase family protein [Amylibacter sp. SFDW26]KAB7613515.1 trimethylamine methyltransferase family protein [Amylibacter sp. SFDW26]